MSGLQGYLYATRKEIIDCTGIDPLDWDPPIEGKVTVEWILFAKDVRGTFITIYDYKGHAPENPDAYFSWHIGGHSADAVGIIGAAFPEHDVRCK